MTTIAWDGETLAIDRGAWKNSCTWHEVQKITHHTISIETCNMLCLPVSTRGGLDVDKKIIYAACGDHGEAELIKAYFNGKGNSRINIEEKNLSKGLILDIEKRKIFCLSGYMTATEILSTPFADGGGFEMALGAMIAGMDARSAIKIVTKHSGWAAGGVSSYTLDHGFNYEGPEHKYKIGAILLCLKNNDKYEVIKVPCTSDFLEHDMSFYYGYKSLTTGIKYKRSITYMEDGRFEMIEQGI